MRPEDVITDPVALADAVDRRETNAARRLLDLADFADEGRPRYDFEFTTYVHDDHVHGVRIDGITRYQAIGAAVAAWKQVRSDSLTPVANATVDVVNRTTGSSFQIVDDPDVDDWMLTNR